MLLLEAAATSERLESEETPKGKQWWFQAESSRAEPNRTEPLKQPRALTQWPLRTAFAVVPNWNRRAQIPQLQVENYF